MDWRVTVDTPILLIAEIISKIHEDLVTFLVVHKWIGHQNRTKHPSFMHAQIT